LEELSEVPGPVAEEPPTEPVVQENGREVGQVWEPARAVPAEVGGDEPVGNPLRVATGAKGPGTGMDIAKSGVKDDGQENEADAKAEPRRFISLLVALPGSGEITGVIVLVALEGAELDADRASPVRLAVERMLPQIRSWAGESIDSPAAISWSPNESLWQAQWQKAQAGREAQTSLSARANRRQMPDLHGASLRKALQVLNQYDLKVRIQGAGRVVEQQPAAGTTLNGNECVLTLSGLNLINETPDRQFAVGVESGTGKLKIFSTVFNPRPVSGGN
ncbi:MAG TPA: PASTA domain-containing protein, partial [Desulfurivibrionaceae bacterium]|nr:PASTA domain-containing protein [Desulfurivibrionaceae bacterium]